MEEEPIVGGGNVGLGDVAAQGHLGGVGGGARGGYEAEAVADAEDVGVHGEGGLAEGYGLDDVGGLAAYAGEAGEFFEGGGYLAAEVADEHAGEAYEVAGLVVGVGDGLDVGQHVLLRGCGHGGGGGVGAEEGGRHLVDALVGALGGEHHGYEELERGGVVEFRLGGGQVGPVVGED